MVSRNTRWATWPRAFSVLARGLTPQGLDRAVEEPDRVRSVHIFGAGRGPVARHRLGRLGGSRPRRRKGRCPRFARLVGRPARGAAPLEGGLSVGCDGACDTPAVLRDERVLRLRLGRRSTAVDAGSIGHGHALPLWHRIRTFAPDATEKNAIRDLLSPVNCSPATCQSQPGVQKKSHTSKKHPPSDGLRRSPIATAPASMSVGFTSSTYPTGSG